MGDQYYSKEVVELMAGKHCSVCQRAITISCGKVWVMGDDVWHENCPGADDVVAGASSNEIEAELAEQLNLADEDEVKLLQELKAQPPRRPPPSPSRAPSPRRLSRRASSAKPSTSSLF